LFPLLLPDTSPFPLLPPYWQYMAILRSNPEVEEIFQEMNAFINEVNFLGDHSLEAFEVGR